MSLSGIKLVTFDVTNTLLKFRAPPHDYYALVARSYGFQGTGNDIKNQLLYSYKKLTKSYPNFGKDSISWQEWWSRVVGMTFQGNLPHDIKVNELSKRLIEDYKTCTCWEIADGCVDLIKLLKSSGIVVGVISNFDPRLHDILRNLSIYDCFKFIITSYEVGVSKPNKKIFEYAQNKYGSNILPSHCLHIGDDIDKDFHGARNAGWHALLINNTSDKISQSLHTYRTLKQLHRAIESNELYLL